MPKPAIVARGRVSVPSRGDLNEVTLRLCSPGRSFRESAGCAASGFLPVLKPKAAVLRCPHAALRGLSKARRGRIRTIGAGNFHGKAENVSALRPIQNARAPDQAEHR